MFMTLDEKKLEELYKKADKSGVFEEAKSIYVKMKKRQKLK